MSRGIKWYNYLKPADRGEGKKSRALLEDEEPEAKTLIVCQELAKKRIFGKFASFMDFGRYSRKEVTFILQTFFEVIFGSMPQKGYFDFETYLPDNSKPGVPLEAAQQMEGVPKIALPEAPAPKAKHSDNFILSAEESEKAVRKLQETVLQVCPLIQPTDIMIFESHGPHKNSYHLVVDNWCVPSAEENRALHDKVMELYPDKWKRAIDHRVYSSCQQLRIFGCHKFGTTRVKVLSTFSTWRSGVPSANEDERYLQILGASLVTNASYCKLLPAYRPPSPPRPLYRGPEIVLKEEEALNALGLCAKAGDYESLEDDRFPFKIKEIKGQMILLKRLAPSYCKVCNREHESENPFLIVVGDQRRVYFDCRRNDKGEKLLLGTLGYRQPEVVEHFTPYQYPPTPKPKPVPSLPGTLPPSDPTLPKKAPNQPFKPAPGMPPTAPQRGLSGVFLALAMQSLDQGAPKPKTASLGTPRKIDSYKLNLLPG